MKLTILSVNINGTNFEELVKWFGTLASRIVSASSVNLVNPDYIRACDDEFDVIVKGERPYYTYKKVTIYGNYYRIKVYVKQLKERNNVVNINCTSIDELANHLKQFAYESELYRDVTLQERLLRLANQNTDEKKAARRAKQKELDELNKNAVIDLTKRYYNIPLGTVSYETTNKKGKVTKHIYRVIRSSNSAMQAYETFILAVLIALQSAKTKCAKLTTKSVSAPKMWRDRINALIGAYVLLIKHYEKLANAGEIRVCNKLAHTEKGNVKVVSQSTIYTADTLILKAMQDLTEKSYDAYDMVSIALEKLLVCEYTQINLYKGVMTHTKLARQTIFVSTDGRRFEPLPERVCNAYKAVNSVINSEAKVYREIGSEASESETDMYAFMKYINTLKYDNNTIEEYVRIAVNRVVKANFKDKEVDFLAYYGRFKAVNCKSGNGRENGIRKCAKVVGIGINRAAAAIKKFKEVILANYPELLDNATLIPESDAVIKEKEFEKISEKYAIQHNYVQTAKTYKQAYYEMFKQW